MPQFTVTLPVGVTDVGPVNLEDGVDHLHVALSNWPQATRTVAIGTEISYDGGATWWYAGGLNPTGGNRDVGRDDTRDVSMDLDIPSAIGQPRKIRATLTVVGGPVTTTVKLETT